MSRKHSSNGKKMQSLLFSTYRSMISSPKTRIFCLFLSVLLLSSSNARANTAAKTLLAGSLCAPEDYIPTSNPIESITKKIILKIIELEKFNLHYRMEVGKQGRWAGWRYATLQETNYCLNLSSGIFNTVERTSHFRHPDRSSASNLAKSSLTSMIGYIIGASAGALELGITQYHDMQASKNGFSPKLATQHVLAVKNELDQLLAERDKLIQIQESAPLLHAQLQIDLAEGQILKDLRDLTLLEYRRFHISARRFVAFQKSVFFLDMTKYTCDAVGSYLSYLALHKRDRRFNQPVGIMYDIAGSLIIATPYLSRGIGILAQKIERHRTAALVADVTGTDLPKLQADELALEQDCLKIKEQPADTDTPLTRLVLYRKEDLHFADELDRNLKQERAGKRTATQNMIAGTFTGSTHLASGILYTTVGTIASGKTLKDAHVTNYNLAAAAIVGITGNTAAILDTMRIQVQAEIRRHKQSKAGKLSSQIFARDLVQLNDMEQQLMHN